MNVTQLLAETDFNCGSTSATFPVSDKIRLFNNAYHDVARLIWSSDSTYTWDESNYTDGPVATRTVANASATYLIPTTAIRIRGVEIKDAGGNWYKLTPLDYSTLDVSPESYLTGTGLPVQYSIQGNEIRLFPAPGTGYVTMSSGMAVRLSRNVTEIATSATTMTPGFPASFHPILSYAASMAFTQDDKQRQFLAVQKDRLEKGLTNFYGHRVNDYKSAIRPSGRRNWRQYY